LRKRLVKEERRLQKEAAFTAWAKANAALGGSAIDPALPWPISP
jgi:hypothetical protein